MPQLLGDDVGLVRPAVHQDQRLALVGDLGDVGADGVIVQPFAPAYFDYDHVSSES
jgi:hypothetical protein